MRKPLAALALVVAALAVVRGMCPGPLAALRGLPAQASRGIARRLGKPPAGRRRLGAVLVPRPALAHDPVPDPRRPRSLIGRPAHAPDPTRVMPVHGPPAREPLAATSPVRLSVAGPPGRSRRGTVGPGRSGRSRSRIVTTRLRCPVRQAAACAAHAVRHEWPVRSDGSRAPTALGALRRAAAGGMLSHSLKFRAASPFAPG